MSELIQIETLKTALVSYIVSKLPTFSVEKHSNTSFSRLGLDSLGHVELSAVIENTINLQVEPDIAFNYPTLDSLTAQIKSLLIQQKSELENHAQV